MADLIGLARNLRRRSTSAIATSWRVYRVADNAPIAKCFSNPAKMLGTRQILLELGLLRAKIEDVG